MNSIFPAVLLYSLMLSLPLVSCLIDPQYNYSKYMIQFSRNYQKQQRQHHQKIFQANYKELLSRIEAGEDLQPSNFLDWNSTQLQTFMNYDPTKLKQAFSSAASLKSSLFGSPNTFDWRSLGRVSPVKNQGGCGSCWAFASIAQYESLLSIASNGITYDLSEQFLIQCDQTSNGCKGGYPFSANKLAVQNGIPLEDVYPYQTVNDNYFKSRRTQICSETNKIKLNKNVTGVYFFNSLTSEDLQQYLVSFGPVGVGLNAKSPSFLNAGSSGLVSCANYSFSIINHAVLLVGYNSTHWFIKNSWGTNWGNNGYAYVDKNADCGIKTYVNVIQVNYTQQLIQVNLTIELSDSGQDGWNGNVVGLKQNGVNVAQFGQNFIKGNKYEPINIKIDSTKQTQIILISLGNKSSEIAFVVRLQNGTTFFSYQGRANLKQNTIFTTFCLKNSCPKSTLKLTINMLDEGNDGWGGFVFGFIQNQNVVGYFGNDFRSGSKLNVDITIDGNISTDLVVLQQGLQSKQVSFWIGLPDGSRFHQQLKGSQFKQKMVLKQFCPLLNCQPSKMKLNAFLSSQRNGWGGNIIGIRQNGIIVQIIGPDFKEGRQMGPTILQINPKLFTDIIILRVDFTVSIGLKILYQNNTVIINRTNLKNTSENDVIITFCPSSYCYPRMHTLIVKMTDSSENGWSGNIIGLKQNGKFIHKFGDRFVNGTFYGPIYLNVNAEIEAQLSVYQASANPSEVGFSVESLNGSLIYEHGGGFFFSSSTIFSTFCLLSNCTSDLISLSIIMKSQEKGGWKGNIIGFKQNGIFVGQFGNNFTSGETYGPIFLKLNKNYLTQLAPLQINNFSNQIGFTVKFSNGTVIYNLNTGSMISLANTFRFFCLSPICLSPTTTLKIKLTDKKGDGWNGNILGFKQNGVIVNKFSLWLPVSSLTTYVTIPNSMTEIVVSQYGSFTQQIGFSIILENGTTVYELNPGFTFNPSSIFTRFCPLLQCPDGALIESKYYVTLIGSCSGWNGNVLGLRQDGLIKSNLSLANGNSSKMIQINLEKYKLVEIVVIVLGEKSWEVGFQIRAQNGYLVLSRSVGTKFYANSIIGSFVANGVNYDPFNELPDRSDQRDEALSNVESINDNNLAIQDTSYINLLIATIILASVLFVVSIALIFTVVALKRAKSSLSTINCQSGKSLTRNENLSPHTGTIFKKQEDGL